MRAAEVATKNIIESLARKICQVSFGAWAVKTTFFRFSIRKS